MAICVQVVNNMMFELSLWRCSDALKEEVLAIKVTPAALEQPQWLSSYWPLSPVAGATC